MSYHAGWSGTAVGRSRVGEDMATADIERERRYVVILIKEVGGERHLMMNPESRHEQTRKSYVTCMCVCGAVGVCVCACVFVAFVDASDLRVSCEHQALPSSSPRFYFDPVVGSPTECLKPS